MVTFKKPAAMITITDNEGTQVQVTEDTYQTLKNDFLAGVWMVLIRVAGRVHSIVLPHIFN